MSQLHAVSLGNGPDLVLLHGWAMHSGVWAPLFESLGSGWRVTCVDLPGHGRSAGLGGLNDLAGVVPERAFWVGWSLGGLWALRFAERFPSRVRALVLVASSPSFVRRDGWPAAMPVDRLEAFAAGLESARDQTLRRFLALQFMGVCGAKEKIADLHRRTGEPPPSDEGLRAGLAALRDWDLRAAFARSRVPMAGVFGALDRLVPAEVARWMTELNPRFSASVVHGAGHAPFLTHPESLTDALGALANGR